MCASDFFSYKGVFKKCENYIFYVWRTVYGVSKADWRILTSNKPIGRKFPYKLSSQE
jgi:hypothetical protein